MARGAEPEVAMLHEEIDAVLFQGDGEWGFFGDALQDFDVFYVELVAGGCPRVGADFAGYGVAVLHPSLKNHPDHELAKRLLPRGAGSIVSFGIKGGRPAGKKFIESLRMISHLANVGDAKTLVIHPASTTHQQMDAAQLKAAGVGEELVRLSIGIEAAADILDDLGQALRLSQKA